MITVYRVEHLDTKEGPYQSCILDGSQTYEDMIWKHACAGNHPSIRYDIGRQSHVNRLNNFKGEWLCGFDHLSKLKKWFKGYLEYLLEEGFGVIEYKIYKKDLIPTKSGKQIVFFPTNKAIHSKHLETFKNKPCKQNSK